MTTSSTCRYCNAHLDGEEIISAHPEETARDMYGWTPENKLRFRRDVIVQFPDSDMPQVEMCPDCNGIWPRDPTRPKAFLNQKSLYLF
jgi:hypothetical protein